MAYLKIFAPDGEMREIHLAGKRLILGRDADFADAVLDDPAVSRMHAMILLTGSDYTIKDMESTGGTFLDRKRIKEAVLENGQSLQIGATVMEFCRSEDDAAADNTADTVDGIAQRFRSLPAGMGLNCRLLYLPPILVFAPGDTILIGSDGISFPNPFSESLENAVLELELHWPDGHKKNFLGEVIHVFRGRLGIKLHAVARADYERLVGGARRGCWISVIKAVE